MLDSRSAWALLQLLAQATVLLARARRHHLHVAIPAVAHPSGDADLRGLAFHKPAEADALHAPGYDIATSFEIRHKAAAIRNQHLAVDT